MQSVIGLTAQVTSNVLRKVLDYCEYHKNDPYVAGDDANDRTKKSTDISEWDQKFLQVDQEMLFEMILVSRNAISPHCIELESLY